MSKRRQQSNQKRKDPPKTIIEALLVLQTVLVTDGFLGWLTLRNKSATRIRCDQVGCTESIDKGSFIVLHPEGYQIEVQHSWVHCVRIHNFATNDLEQAGFSTEAQIRLLDWTKDNFDVVSPKNLRGQRSRRYQT